MKLQNNLILGMFALSAAFASCSSSDEPANGVNNDSTEAISLSTYVARNVASRAVVETQSTLQTNGIGVFAYYNDGKSFAESASTLAAAPNFMSKQKVTYNGEGWEYSPVRYWSKTATDKYQFLAYAPFASGDFITTTAVPTLAYDATTTANVGGYDFMTAVNKDQTKPTDKTVQFNFVHRLSRLGFMAKTAADYTDKGNGATITITSAKLSGASLKGSYDLLTGMTNATGGWSNLSVADFTVLASTDAAKEITTTSSNFMNGTDQYLFAIPAEKAKLSLAISYEIKQGDVVYKETATLDKEQTLEMGKAYNFVLTIGLDEIKFNVQSVADWGNETALDQTI